MTVTRASLRTRSLQLADAVSSARWDVTAGAAGEVDQHMGIVHSREWRRILNAQPDYRIAQRTPTSDSQGRFLISALSDLSVADQQQRFYRVRSLAINNRPYREINATDGYLAAASLTSTSSVPIFGFWFRQGDYIIVPDAPNQTATGIWVNHLPTRADNLSIDTAVVEFIDDYEDILAYEVAAILLSKGAAETDASAQLKALAEGMRTDMLQDLTRMSTKPLVMRFPDTAAEWAG